MAKIYGNTITTPIDPNLNTDFASAIKLSESGQVVKVKDVSPAKHNLDVKLKPKNLLTQPFTDLEGMKNDVWWSPKTDGTIIANGTAKNDTTFTVKTGEPLETGEYTLSGCFDKGRKIIGENLVVNGSFEADGGWSKTAGASDYNLAYSSTTKHLVRDGKWVTHFIVQGAKMWQYVPVKKNTTYRFSFDYYRFAKDGWLEARVNAVPQISSSFIDTNTGANTLWCNCDLPTIKNWDTYFGNIYTGDNEYICIYFAESKSVSPDWSNYLNSTHTMIDCVKLEEVENITQEIIDDSTGETLGVDIGRGVTVSVDKPTSVTLKINVKQGATVKNAVFKPQLEKGTRVSTFIRGDITDFTKAPVGHLNVFDIRSHLTELATLEDYGLKDYGLPVPDGVKYTVFKANSSLGSLANIPVTPNKTYTVEATLKGHYSASNTAGLYIMNGANMSTGDTDMCLLAIDLEDRTYPYAIRYRGYFTPTANYVSFCSVAEEIENLQIWCEEEYTDVTVNCKGKNLCSVDSVEYNESGTAVFKGAIEGVFSFSFTDNLVGNVDENGNIRKTGAVFVVFYENGKYFLHTLNKANTRISVSGRIVEIRYLNWNRATGGSIDNIQLEAGDKRTEFENVKPLQDITANADGTVKGVASVSPNTTLLTLPNCAYIGCSYNTDTKTYIDRKFEELSKTLLNN